MVQSIVTTKDTIVSATCRLLMARGIRELTVARVAKQAGVSSALVHYHCATKQALLAAAAARLAAGRTTQRVSALDGGQGLGALDLLWESLARDGIGPSERVWHDLLLLAREEASIRDILAAERDRERAAIAHLLPRLLAGLGVTPTLPPEELAAMLCTFLDGVAVGLASGTNPKEVRVAFDAFWLALVAPPPPPGPAAAR